MKIEQSRTLRISEFFIDEDDLFLSTFPVQHVALALALIGVALCAITDALYFSFGVFRSDNFWIPALASFYALIFGLMILAVAFRSSKLMHPFLVTQIVVIGFIVMTVVVFILVTIIALINNSSEFLEQRDLYFETHPIETPLIVSLAGRATLIYICVICSFALPVVLHAIGVFEEEQWTKRRRQMAERRQKQADATVAAPPAGGGAGGHQQQMNETGGRSVLFQKKRNGNKSVTIPSIPTISTAEKEANTTFDSTAADDGDDLNGSKTVIKIA